MDANGKYTYTETENGTYSWNASAKTVTFKPAKVVRQDNDGLNDLQVIPVTALQKPVFMRMTDRAAGVNMRKPPRGGLR